MKASLGQLGSISSILDGQLLLKVLISRLLQVSTRDCAPVSWPGDTTWEQSVPWCPVRLFMGKSLDGKMNGNYGAAIPQARGAQYAGHATRRRFLEPH